MKEFEDFLAQIEDSEHRARVDAVLSWVAESYPELNAQMKWNQPMFTDHGTFIIGFSGAKNHMSVAPEAAGIERFADEIAQAGYSYTKNLLRISWGDDVDYELLARMIDFNIAEKADCETFWRQT